MKKNFLIFSLIVSLILAAISIFWGWMNLGGSGKLGGIFSYGEDVDILFYARIFIPLAFVSLLFNIAGLIRGSKIVSILGIILSMIALLLWLINWLWVVGWSLA